MSQFILILAYMLTFFFRSRGACALHLFQTTVNLVKRRRLRQCHIDTHDLTFEVSQFIDLFGYNFDIDDGAESKFGKHKEVIAL